MLNSIKSWSVTCGLRLNGLDSSVSFIPGFCAPSRVSRVVYRRPSLFSCTMVTQLLWNWMMHWWWVNCKARARTVSLHPTINTEHETAWTGRKYRLTSLWCDPTGNRVKPIHLWWRAQTQPYRIGGFNWILWRKIKTLCSFIIILFLKKYKGVYL